MPIPTDRLPSLLGLVTHRHLVVVLELQAEVVPLDEVHVGADQVEQHLARSSLLEEKGEKNGHTHAQ